MECEVIIAVEDSQEKLLKTEFPSLLFVHLRGYRISYSRYKRIFPLKIALQVPKIILAILNEKQWLKAFAKTNKIDAIISDNRYGLYHSNIRSVFISHQLLIKAPVAAAENILQKINYQLIQNFSCCWIPDEQNTPNLAGKLSHPARLPKIPTSYLGGLSRLEIKAGSQYKHKILIIISGPEPQRNLLEQKMLGELATFDDRVLLIRGLPGSKQVISALKNITIKNHLPAAELEQAFMDSEYVISRSGYTTVMDICKLKKKSILIPTPGQTEQEYLAAHLQKQGWCLAADQRTFSIRQAIKDAESFAYQMPTLNMEAYKEVVKSFIDNLTEPA